ncbi:MAG: TlyA family RNA methyltransferase [Deltaproteobacteria bacterium]|nr:TlyA family RNA methyltransferase [Deltaproteobacteria bacterium]
MISNRTKLRLDILVAERGLADSRQKARALIMAGKVLVDDVRIDKPGRLVSPDAHVSVAEELPFVSRGGLKLAAALDAFSIDPSGLRVLDAGASTGGFTDCLLKRGALGVVAVDVGYGQLHWTLRNDPRVTVMEKTNVRLLTADLLPHPIDAAVSDLSFISLKLVLPVLGALVPTGGWIVPLVKPQFEVGRYEVGKGGVVRDLDSISRVLEELKQFSERVGLEVLGQIESPIRGPKGNTEFFLHLKKTGALSSMSTARPILKTKLPF